MAAISERHKAIITARDLLRRGRGWGRDDRGAIYAPSKQLLRGRNEFLTLRDGLTVHYSDAEELQNLTVEAQSAPHLSVKVFLEGSVEATIGSFRVPMATRMAGSSQWRPTAFLLAQSRTERFFRRSSKGTRLRKVVINIAPCWLDRYATVCNDGLAAIRDFAKCHLACRTWTPSDRAIALAEQILNAPDQPSFLYELYIESRALGLISEAFQQLLTTGNEPDLMNLRAQDRLRLKRFEAFLMAHTDTPLTTEIIAREIGVSVNTLQRLFHNAYGTSVFEFVRGSKLQKARTALEDGVSIAEAAYIAGYASPANFATAFKRHFGLSPKDARTSL